MEECLQEARLMATGSHDGTILQWDISRALVLYKHQTSAEEGDMRKVFKVKFSPRDDYFAATDCGGRVHLFGYGEFALYENIPDEQFFHNDYQGTSQTFTPIFFVFARRVLNTLYDL